MKVQRVEKHVLKKNSEYFDVIDHYCLMAKNLWNHGMYVIRQSFFKEDEKYLNYYDLDSILKKDVEYPDYRNTVSAQSSQQLLLMLDRSWKSFFKSSRDFKAHPDKYTGRPKLPKYKDKDGRQTFIITSQEIKQDNNLIKFPKKLNGFSIEARCLTKENLIKVNQVRFVPRGSQINVEVIYEIKVPELRSEVNRICGIDIGVDNLAAVSNNIGEKPFVVNGKGLKSVNQYYNKHISHYKEVTKRCNNLNKSSRQEKLTKKRNLKIDDAMHKSSRFIIDWCNKNNIDAIVIGHNKLWKQSVELGRRNNQVFTQIPFSRFIDMVTYKAQEFGIQVILTEESYTSGTSFLDEEQPTKEFYNKSRRIKRGLFQTNKSNLVNADINASLQIIKKVLPNAFANGIEGVGLHPFRVNLV